MSSFPGRLGIKSPNFPGLNLPRHRKGRMIVNEIKTECLFSAVVIERNVPVGSVIFLLQVDKFD